MSFEDMIGDTVESDRPNAYDAARAESDLAFIAKKRREIEWWQHNIKAAEEKLARAEERLKSFAIAYRQTVGGSQISLANGFVAISKQRERTEIYDRSAYTAWALAGVRHWPDHVYDKHINDAKLKNLLTIQEDGSFVYKHGDIAGQPVLEIVPGIRRVKPGPLDFNVKINAGRLDPFEKRHVARTINEESNDADESE